MKTAIVVVLLAAMTCYPAHSYAKAKHLMQLGKVLSQNVDSYNAGAAVVPMFGGLVGVPITRRSNFVQIQTDSSLMSWSEVGNRTIVLPVGGMVFFYQDKNYYVVRDAQNKKHRFVLTHMEAR